MESFKSKDSVSVWPMEFKTINSRLRRRISCSARLRSVISSRKPCKAVRLPVASRIAIESACEHGRNVGLQQLVAILIAQHAHERVVEIQESSLRCGDKHAFLHIGHQRAVFFLRPFAFGNVFQSMDR